MTMAADRMPREPLVRRGERGRRAAAARPGERVRFWLVAGVLAVCLVGGGSSWETSLSLLYLRPLLILTGAALLLLPDQQSGAAVLRMPALLLGIFAATMVVQLVPLPPAWWQALPGRQPYAAAARLVGQGELWRPISLSPDRTLNSILALLPAAVVLLGARGLSRQRLEDLVPVLLAGIAASAVLGVVQWTGTGYLYRQASIGFPTGFLANRNHQAVFLALAFPLLRAWLEILRGRGLARPWQPYAAAGGSLFLIAIIVTTGSRAGLAAAALALVASWFVVPVANGPARWSRATRRRAAAAAAVATLLIGTLFLFGRAVSVDRLTDADNYTAELRVRFTPLLLDLVHRFGWAGSGFGTFDAVFRAIEPDWALKPTFFNRAHNEVLEVAITGGILALAAVAAFLAWAAGRIVAAWRRMRPADATLARSGSVVAVLLLLASLPDYPLRTPLLGAVLAVAVAWLAPWRKESDRQAG